MKKFNKWISPVVLSMFVTGSSSAFCDNVITSGTNLKVLPGTSLVSIDNMVIKSGATLENSGMLILKKNLTNENPAPISIGPGTTEFSGLVSQSIAGQQVINHLTVNNPAGVSVEGNTKVTGNLTLTSGRVSLGNSNLTLGPLAAIVGAPSASAMIVVTETGELRKEFPDGFTGSFLFPVGDNTAVAEYSPVTLVMISATFVAGNWVGVSLKNEKYPDPNITGNYLNRYWTLSQSGITGFIGNADFQYVPADVEGSENLISCTKVHPLPWTTFALTNPAMHLLTASGITSFSSFTGLKSTTAPMNQELINVTIPAGETNCYDAQQILTVAGNGSVFVVENSGSVTLIAGEKIAMLPGVIVHEGGYLLAKISTNFCGAMQNPLVVNQEVFNDQVMALDHINKSGWIRIYPNPTDGMVILEFSQEKAPVLADVTIYNIHGKTIQKHMLKNVHREQFSLASLPAGLYIIQVQTDARMELARIIRK